MGIPIETLEQKLCECNCGNLAPPGRRYIRGHHLIGKKRIISVDSINKQKQTCESKRNGTYVYPVSKPCKCGCDDLASPGKDYILGHHMRCSPYNERMRKSNPMFFDEPKFRSVHTRKENGSYENIRKTNRENGVYEKMGAMAKERMSTNNPMWNKSVVDKVDETKRREGTYERVGILHSVWAKTKKGKSSLSKSGSKGLEVSLSHSRHIWDKVHFLSKEEMLCAQMILTKPIKGINCHIRIGRKTIDFFPQLGDKAFVGSFVEYHPCKKFLNDEKPESYYEKRRLIIDDSKYEDSNLFLILSIKELKEELKEECKQMETSDSVVDAQCLLPVQV